MAGVRALVVALALVTFSCAVVQAASRKDGAFLVLSRTLKSDLVEGINFTVSYEIHNVGETDATSLQLRDTAFPASRFTVFDGDFRKTWGRLNAGESLNMDVIALPKRSGELLVNPAALSYKDGDDKRTTRLAAAETMIVEDQLEYRRRTDTHGGAWAAYGAACAAAIGAPYVLHLQSASSLPSEGASAKKRS